MIFIFVIGLIIGSFLNVCIYRLPRERSLIHPPSHCPGCYARLKALDLIPVLSYVLSSRRCRYCGKWISPRYVIVELMTAFLFIWCFLVFGWTGKLAAACIFSAFMVVVSFIDYDCQLILDKVVLWFAFTGFVISYCLGYLTIAVIVAALVGGGLLLLIAVLSRGGMGGGDVKFSFALGIWLGWPDILIALFLSFIIGGLVGVLLLLTGQRGRKDMIPFGPFLCIGAFICLLYGSEILAGYFGLTR